MTTFADLTDDEIIAVLNTPTDDPATRQFLGELLEDYEPGEIPDVLRTLSRAAEALKDKPADFDLMILSLRELGPVIGGSAATIDVPGVTDRIAGFWDLPLRELNRHIGPFDLRHLFSEYGKRLDAETARFQARADQIRKIKLENFADLYRFPL